MPPPCTDPPWRGPYRVEVQGGGVYYPIVKNPGADWSEQVGCSVPVITKDEQHGYRWIGFGLQKDELRYFLIEPKAYGGRYVEDFFHILVIDASQAAYVNIYYPVAYKLDANNREIDLYQIEGAGDFSKYIEDFTREEYDSGAKFLVEIKEKGRGSQTQGVTARWSPL